MSSIAENIKGYCHQGDVYPGVLPHIRRGLHTLNSNFDDSTDIFCAIAEVLIEDDLRGFPIYGQRIDCRNIAVLVEDENVEFEVQNSLFGISQVLVSLSERAVFSGAADTAWRFLCMFGEKEFIGSSDAAWSDCRVIAVLLRESSQSRGASYLNTLDKIRFRQSSTLLAQLADNPFELIANNQNMEWFDGKIETLVLWHFWRLETNFESNAISLLNAIKNLRGVGSLEIALCRSLLSQMRQSDQIQQSEIDLINCACSGLGWDF